MFTWLALRRLLLFVAPGSGVVVGMGLPAHSHKVIASLLFGVGTGLVWLYCWRAVRKHSPDVLARNQRSVEEAQEMLRGMFQFRLGFNRPRVPPPSLLRLDQVLSDTISIVLAICLAATVWVLPVFWMESDPGVRGTARTAAAHLFDLACVAIATIGLTIRIGGRSGDAP
jgi:hypothetical protein